MSEEVDGAWSRSREAAEVRRLLAGHHGVMDAEDAAGGAGRAPACGKPFKVVVVGREGCGKTCTVASLAGREAPSAHEETRGVQVADVRWAFRSASNGAVTGAEMHLWDAGSGALERFPYLARDAAEAADAALYVCSALDAASLDETEQRLRQGPRAAPVRAVVVAKADVLDGRQVALADLKAAAGRAGVPFFPLANACGAPAPAPGARAPDAAAVLDYLAAELAAGRRHG